jgi:hypothetical protein
MPHAATVPGIARQSGGTGPVAQTSGEVAGVVFALLEEGVAPAEIVRQERLLPHVVLDLHRQFTALRELGGTGKPSTADRLGTVERAVRDQGLATESLAQEAGTELTALGSRIAALERFVATLPRAICPDCGVGVSHVPVRCKPCADGAYLVSVQRVAS